MGFLLLGGPGETSESVDESLAFARSLNLEMLKVSVGIRLYPHTPPWPPRRRWRVYPREQRMEGLRQLVGLPKNVIAHSLVVLGYAAE